MIFPKLGIPQPNIPLVLGYYPVRAKAQLCRLLCEYLHVPYIDRHFNPKQWDQIKLNQARTWIIKDLPFIIDEDFVITGSTGCSHYLIQKAGRLDLLGRTLQDNIKIITFGNRKDLLAAIIGLICKVKANHTIDQTKQSKQALAGKIELLLRIHEKEAKENDWYFGYLSLMDFIIYLVMDQLEQSFPSEVLKFQKLKALKARVQEIPEIYNYQHSVRAVRCYNPVEYFNNFKEEMSKNIVSCKLMQQNDTKMELQ